MSDPMIEHVTRNVDIHFSPDDAGWYAQCFLCNWTGQVWEHKTSAKSDARLHQQTNPGRGIGHTGGNDDE